MNYQNLSELEKNQITKQYERLVNKIINQFFQKGVASWNILNSMAWEGFALALNNYDETRSKMNFTQYAGFSIRNNILSCLNEELRTVKLSAYAQQKTKEWYGESATFNTISLEKICGNNSQESNSEYSDNRSGKSEFKYGLYEHDKFSDGDVFEYMYRRLEDKFNQLECDIFYYSFGLKDYNTLKGIEIAKKFNISPSAVSVKVKKITEYIKKDTELCEMLQNLFR